MPKQDFLKSLSHELHYSAIGKWVKLSDVKRIMIDWKLEEIFPNSINILHTSSFIMLKIDIYIMHVNVNVVQIADIVGCIVSWKVQLSLNLWKSCPHHLIFVNANTKYFYLLEYLPSKVCRLSLSCVPLYYHVMCGCLVWGDITVWCVGWSGVLRWLEPHQYPDTRAGNQPSGSLKLYNHGQGSY